VDAEGVVDCGASPKGRRQGDPPTAALPSSPSATNKLSSPDVLGNHHLLALASQSTIHQYSGLRLPGPGFHHGRRALPALADRRPGSPNGIFLLHRESHPQRGTILAANAPGGHRSPAAEERVTMKKSIKRLSLAKETLYSLETGWHLVIGGTDTGPVLQVTASCKGSCGGTCTCGNSVQACCV